VRLTDKVKTVKVRPIDGNISPKHRKMPMVLMAAIKNIYNRAWPLTHIEGGHYRMETLLCTVDYTVPSPDGRCCLMRAYRKEDSHGKPDKTPFCVARYIMEDKNGRLDGDRH